MAITVKNISEYANISETISAFTANYNEMSGKKSELKSLFQSSFATMGAQSEQAKTLEREIEELENLIKVEQEKIEKWNKIILESTDEIGRAKNSLDNLIAEYLAKNESHQQQVKNSISSATKIVLDDFANGRITQDEISTKIQERVSGMQETYDFPAAKVATLSSVIQSKTNEIANLIMKRNLASNKVSTAQGAMQLLNEMYKVQIKALGTRATGKGANNAKPVYTPQKQAFVEQLYAKYHATATAGADQYSINNVQVQNIGEALGVKNVKEDGTTSYNLTAAQDTTNLSQAERNNLFNGSILQDMFNMGFTYKEAMYACQYIFGTSANLLSLNADSGVLSIAHGHGTDGHNVLYSFVNQTKALWGKDATSGTGGGGSVSTSTSVPVDTTPVVTTPVPTTTTPIVKRTDPIGWQEGNVTFDFVVDRNNDGKFNDETEFLGAQNGLAELSALDLDGNGKVEGSELEGLMLLRTDHSVKGFGFMTAADAGITSIDLNSLQQLDPSKQHANVNGNKVQATFGITLGNKTVTGYQSLDDNEYLAAVYGDRYGKEMSSKIDFSNSENLAALNKISGFTSYNTDAEIAEMKAETAAIFADFNRRKAAANQEVTAANIDLIQDLSQAINQTESQAEVIADEQTQAADEAEYQRHQLESRMQALEHQLGSIELELENIENDNSDKANARREELTTLKQTKEDELSRLRNQLNLTQETA